jgi:hypothetical protein
LVVFLSFVWFLLSPPVPSQSRSDCLTDGNKPSVDLLHDAHTHTHTHHSAPQELRLGGETVRGEDLLQQLDKARRKQDAEAIMAFIAMVERHMKAHAHAYHSPYLEQRRRELAEEYVKQQSMHREIARQVPLATTPVAAVAAAADAAMVPKEVEAAAGSATVGPGTPF